MNIILPMSLSRTTFLSYAMSQMIATSAPLRDAVTQVITHRFPAEQWEEAFATARSGQCGKVILDWS